MNRLSQISRAQTGRALRFLGAGTLATGAHWVLMAALLIINVPALAATMAGSVVGAAVNYILQHRITFRDRHYHSGQRIRYLLSCLILWISNAVMFFLAVKVSELAVWQAQFLATAATAVAAYLIYHSVVFVGETRS